MASALARLKSAVAGARAGWGGVGGPVNWTQNGGIPVSWSPNWWQQGFNPLRGGESATVNACVNAYAMTIAQLPGGHFRKIPGAHGAAEPVTNSPVARVLREPNGYQTRSDFVLNLVTQLLFYGNAYAWAEREGGQVAALHLMPPRAAEPYIEPESRAVFYRVTGNDLAGQFAGLAPARDVLHVRCRVHPDRPLHGITPITWAAMARDANVAIAASQAAFFTNASQPSGFLSTKERLTPEQMATLRAAWEDRATGMAMGTVPILGGGMEFQQMGITSQDAQLVEAFGMTVADIARAFAVPVPIIGDLSNATFNNVENLIALWLSQGLGFYLEHIELALDKFFGLGPGEYVEFDADTLMRTAFRDRIEGLARAVAGGLYSPDEARGREGLPPAPDGWGEEPRLQAQVVPLSAAGDIGPSAPAAPALPPPDEGDDGEGGDSGDGPDAAERRLAELVTAGLDRLATVHAEETRSLAARLDALDARLPEPEPPGGLDVTEAKAMLDAIAKGARDGRD